MSMIYLWHSINIVPYLDTYRVHKDQFPYEFSHSVLEITVFGIVIDINIPMEFPHFSTPLVGPLWSRYRGKWYFPNKNV